MWAGWDCTHRALDCNGQRTGYWKPEACTLHLTPPPPCRGGAPRPPPPPAQPSSCPLAGSIQLTLVGASDPAGAYPSGYATCFARFAVEVGPGCELLLVPPPAAARWLYSSLWSPVPTQQRNMQVRGACGEAGAA